MSAGNEVPQMTLIEALDFYHKFTVDASRIGELSVKENWPDGKFNTEIDKLFQSYSIQDMAVIVRIHDEHTRGMINKMVRCLMMANTDRILAEAGLSSSMINVLKGMTR